MWIETLNEYSTPNRIGAGSRIAPTPYGFVCQRGKYQTRFYSNRKPDLGQNNSAGWKPILTKYAYALFGKTVPTKSNLSSLDRRPAPYISNLSLGYSLFTFPVNEISMNHSLPGSNFKFEGVRGNDHSAQEVLSFGGEYRSTHIVRVCGKSSY